MKVPTLSSPRAQVVNDTANYSTFRPDPAAFGAGLGNALGNLGAAIQQREEKTDRFTAVTNFSEFETEANAKLLEAARAAPADGRGFARSTEDAYDKASEEFINNRIPATMRDEFRARIAQQRQGIVGKALDFQYKQGDAYFKQGIAKQYEAARSALDPRLGGDPKNLEAQRAKLTEIIDSSDLPDADKLQLKDRMNAGLESVGYRAAVTQEAARTGGHPEAANLIMSEEGFRDTPYWDVTAYRTGYGSDTITKADGTVVKVTPDMKITREDADRDLARRIPEFQRVASGQIGAETWNALPGNIQAALTSVTYNYGKLPGSVVEAVKTGDRAAIASAVGSLDSNKTRRQREAKIIMGEATVGSPVDQDAAFANVPYESRISLREDAVRDATAQITADAKQKKAAYDTSLNSMLTSIHDGVAGQTDIDAFRATNPGMDFNDIGKMEKALKDYSEGVGLAATGQTKLNAGLTFDPTDTDDKKRVNAMVGKEGLASLQEMDKDYVTTSLTPMVSGTGMIPTDVSGLLSGMVRGSNQQKALFALNTLQQLADANPRAFAQLPEDLQKDVDIWNRRAGKAPDEEILKALNPGTSIEQRNADKELRKQATDILSTKTNKVPTIDVLVKDFLGDQDSWIPFTGTTSAGAIPWAAQALYNEFQTEFTDAYVKTGNEEDAADSAKATLAKRWAVTTVGNKVLMRNPPESVYKPYRGGYDWIGEQVRKENNLTPDTQFQLISDDTTNQEVAAFRAGTLDRPPSYKVTSYVNGVWKELPGRQWFKVDDADRELDNIMFEKDVEIKQAEREVMDLEKAVTKNQPGLFNVAPEDADELNEDFNAAMDRLNKLRGERETLNTKPTDYVPLNTNPMGDMF